MSPDVLVYLQALNVILSVGSNLLEGGKRLKIALLDEDGNLREITQADLDQAALQTDTKIAEALTAINR